MDLQRIMDWGDVVQAGEQAMEACGSEDEEARWYEWKTKEIKEANCSFLRVLIAFDTLQTSLSYTKPACKLKLDVLFPAELVSKVAAGSASAKPANHCRQEVQVWSK